jgi:putative FmdB family regulatory protein
MEPLYVYKCDQCNHVFETRHSMFFEGLVTCPECDSDKTHKVPTAPGVIFNWHQADGVKIGPERYRPPAVTQSAARL